MPVLATQAVQQRTIVQGPQQVVSRADGPDPGQVRADPAAGVADSVAGPPRGLRAQEEIVPLVI
jgi:hypothetical protein